MPPAAVGDPTDPEQVPEGLIDGFAVIGPAMGRRKKDGVRRLQAHRVGIVVEALGERWREWDQAVFAELALVDSQDSRLQIHITTPYAITNPIWIDVDGNGWTPPRPPLPPPGGSARPSPDVRAQFDALPEVSP